MGDSPPASHGPTLTALTPTTRPSFLPTLLAEISLGHFIQWGREGHPTDNYYLAFVSASSPSPPLDTCVAVPLPFCHLNVNCLCGHLNKTLNAKGPGHSNSFHLTCDARWFRKDTGCIRGILGSEFQEPYHSIF